MPRRSKRSTKNSRAKHASPSDELPTPLEETPAPEAEAPPATPPIDPHAELTAAEQLVEQQFPPPPPPAAAPPQPEKDAGAEMAEGLEGMASELVAHPELLDLLNAEELGATFELAFGMVADWRKRPHWELPEKSALRLGKWTRQVLLRHPEFAAWIGKHLADVILGLVLFLEVGRRVAQDRKLAQAETVEHEEVKK